MKRIPITPASLKKNKKKNYPQSLSLRVRCADVAIILPNKAESQTVALKVVGGGRMEGGHNRGLTSSPTGVCGEVGGGGAEGWHTQN